MTDPRSAALAALAEHIPDPDATLERECRCGAWVLPWNWENHLMRKDKGPHDDPPPDTFRVAVAEIQLDAILANPAHRRALLAALLPVDELAAALAYGLQTHLCYSNATPDDKAMRDVMLPRIFARLTSGAAAGGEET